jgi:hypothetical protein
MLAQVSNQKEGQDGADCHQEKGQDLAGAHPRQCMWVTRRKDRTAHVHQFGGQDSVGGIKGEDNVAHEATWREDKMVH